MILNRNSKKGQEEVVGFVAIVVLVTIAGVVLLGFILNSQNTSTGKESKDIQRFLESTLAYTTNCSFNSGYQYSTISELSRECYNYPQETCSTGESVCDSLNSTIRGILSSAWGNPDNSTYVSGYYYYTHYTMNSTNGDNSKDILIVKEGDCLNKNFISYSMPPIQAYPGEIDISLRVCLNS